jgi:thiol-disulfide isomerase/thioredoxin
MQKKNPLIYGNKLKPTAMMTILKYLPIVLILLIISFPGAAGAKKPHKVLHMPPTKIADFVEKTAGEKRVVMVYTSWCPFCRKIMPKVMDIEKIMPGSVIAISEDEDHAQFAKYIEKYPKIPFTIFLSKPTATKTLSSVFAEQLGTKPWSGYPHFILLDAENNISGEGNFDADRLADFLLSK